MRRSGGMADAAASKAVEGNLMGVQVPSPAPAIDSSAGSERNEELGINEQTAYAAQAT